MKKLNNENIQAYFQAGNSGFWKVESEEGKKTRLYTDEITNELFGITEDLSPEKCMEYVAEHIYPQERESFWDYMKELKRHESEAVYRYMHPVKGVIYIRCTGRRVPSPDNMIRLVGYHQEAARQIRAMDRPDAKLIPIVAMSANAFQDDVERSIKAGMNKHISKPLTGESVIREIKSML